MHSELMLHHQSFNLDLQLQKTFIWTICLFVELQQAFLSRKTYIDGIYMYTIHIFFVMLLYEILLLYPLRTEENIFKEKDQYILIQYYNGIKAMNKKTFYLSSFWTRSLHEL